jgi:hypothetical protein
MTRESIDHILVKYILSIKCILDNDDGIHKLALHIKSLEEHIAKLESSKTCKNCQYEHLDRYGDNHCKFENMCMRDFDDYYKAKETK